ncbi:MAG: hypothetical protein GEU87_16100 [Alphaproteobacteria bacterium]|nr:hypothetical protein [Alphaproteobacteria bacterium]
MQFNEVIARIFYDQTVLDDQARDVTYFWNEKRRAVISMVHTSRFYDPYLHDNHDRKRFAHFLARYTFCDPQQVVSGDGDRFYTMLIDNDGKFMKFPVTEAEIAMARHDPNRRVIGPLNARRREDPPLD